MTIVRGFFLRERALLSEIKFNVPFFVHSESLKEKSFRWFESFRVCVYEGGPHTVPKTFAI